MLTRVTIVIALVLQGSACAPINPQTFAPLIQHGDAIVEALGERPSLPKFRPLRQNFSTALQQVRPALQSSAERTLFGDYEVIDARLGEMLSVWTGLVEQDAAMLPLTQPMSSALKARYDLPVNTNDPPGVYAEEALAALRTDIATRLLKAREALRR